MSAMNSTLDEIAARAKALQKDIGADETAYITDAILMLIARVKLAEDALNFMTMPITAETHTVERLMETIMTDTAAGKKALAAARKLEHEFQEKHK